MATMADLDELALALPETTKSVSATDAWLSRAKRRLARGWLEEHRAD